MLLDRPLSGDLVDVLVRRPYEILLNTFKPCKKICCKYRVRRVCMSACGVLSGALAQKILEDPLRSAL